MTTLIGIIAGIIFAVIIIKSFESKPYTNEEWEAELSKHYDEEKWKAYYEKYEKNK